MIQYIQSLFSLKKIIYPYVSMFSLWDKNTSFDKTSALRHGCRCHQVKIGRYSSVGVDSKLIRVEIGNFSVIARNCNIGLGAHPTNYLTTHSIFYKMKPWSGHPEWCGEVDFSEDKITTIGNGVFIGAHVIIMDGVTIGDGAIIAAGAVVSKDVPPYTIVGGAPAKIIKPLFSEDMINRLESIKWWNLPDEKITEIVDLFHIKHPTIDDLNHYFPHL